MGAWGLGETAANGMRTARIEKACLNGVNFCSPARKMSKLMEGGFAAMRVARRPYRKRLTDTDSRATVPDRNNLRNLTQRKGKQCTHEAGRKPPASKLFWQDYCTAWMALMFLSPKRCHKYPRFLQVALQKAPVNIVVDLGCAGVP